MVTTSWRDGWRRVRRAPAVAVGVFGLTFLLALPLAITMRGALRAHLGSSLAADTAADGVNYDWWQEFASQATGLGSTFTPNIIGFTMVLDNISSVLDGRARVSEVSAALALYLAGWAFLSGGILDRYARQRPTRAHGFFAASGVHLFRFLRLAAVAGLAYWWLFAYLHPWLFDTQYVNVTRGLDSERTAFALRLLAYALFGAPVALVNLCVDYAKVRIVVEDRRSAIGAVLASLAFIRRHARKVLGLSALNALVFAAALLVWAIVAPGAGTAGLSMWAAFALSQLYVAVRLLLKLQTIASQVSLFQATLAHAAFTRAPAVVWPESPSAETIAPAGP
jgi:hypothetical protein